MRQSPLEPVRHKLCWHDNAIELEHDYEEAMNNRAIVIQQIGSHNDGKVA